MDQMIYPGAKIYEKNQVEIVYSLEICRSENQ